MVHLYIIPSDPCYLWCSPLPYGAPVPVIPLMKSMTQFLLQTGTNDVILSNLFPATDYSVYCYAETLGSPGVAMTTAVEETRTDISTTTRRKWRILFPLESQFHATITASFKDITTVFPVPLSIIFTQSVQHIVQSQIIVSP